MEPNLILTAKSWQLASQLERTRAFGGVQCIKNIPERTYLCVTPKQWLVLSRFNEPRTVPQVLEAAVDERICPALNEFYELIVKAVRAKVLVEPKQTVTPFPAVNWPLSLKPRAWCQVMWLLLIGGLIGTLSLKPTYPVDWADAGAGLGITIATALVGMLLGATLLRGASGEVYFRNGFLATDDICMLAPREQRLITLTPIALMAAMAGFVAWWRPEWSSFPIAGLLFQLRPILSGPVNNLIRLGSSERRSDAEQRLIFPYNRTVRARLRAFRRDLRSGMTWVEIAYGVFWTFLLAYFFGTLAEMPPWRIEFWQTQSLRLALAILGSVILVGVMYLFAQSLVFARNRFNSRSRRVKRWYRRWFGNANIPTDDAARLRALLHSPLRMLPPPNQQALLKLMRPYRAGARKTLHAAREPVSHLSIILSGKVGVYRQTGAGRRVLVQVLAESDLVGLHAVADPSRPEYLYRTITPVLMLRMEWADATANVLSQLPPTVLANQVQKIPFLTGISLCQHWHRQAIQRFAELSRVRDYAENEVILEQGFYSESFFIMLEGEAHVVSRGKRIAVIGSTNYFGEIGLLQNSNATARVIARSGARCLCIPRKEFLRFVAHNHTVALELERVSSKRLGRPIFPLSPGNFRQH